MYNGSYRNGGGEGRKNILKNTGYNFSKFNDNYTHKSKKPNKCEAKEMWRKSHRVIKLLKISDKEVILKAIREKKMTHYKQRNTDQEVSRCLIQNRSSEKAVEQYLQSTERKSWNSRPIENLSFKKRVK